VATDDPDTNVDIGKVGHLIPKMQPDTTARQRPDEIAHTLVTNVGESIRVYLEDGRITVPVEPCRGGTPVTTTVALDCFDAVVERAAIEDGGLNLFCMDGLHLPESEWRRSGLERHWCADDADLESPFFPPQRRLEVWASREDALFDAGEPYDFSHLDGLPEDSPVLTEWAEHATGEYPDRPPVPFERPTLSVDTVRAEGVTDVRGFDRVEVGRISRVELLDEIDEAPTEPDVEPREVDVSPPSPHPEIDYDALDPLPRSEDLLVALFTINRHAKRLDEQADAAYEHGHGAEARAHALRKRALYRTKTVVLHRLAKSDPDAIRVVRHELDGDVENRVLSRGAFLYEEPEFLLRQELREPATYMAILEAIANGATRVTEIANEIGRDASALSRYLSNLARLALVERETPVTDPDGRGVYRPTDQFLRFWFRYVSPNRATLEQGRTEPVRESIAETLPAHVSGTFEAVCRQAVRTPAFPVPCTRVGRWWYDELEVDVAGVDEASDTLLLGECKWTAETVGPELLRQLEALEEKVRWHGADRSVVYALFAKSGFDGRLQSTAAERDDVRLFTVNDVLDLFEGP